MFGLSNEKLTRNNEIVLKLSMKSKVLETQLLLLQVLDSQRLYYYSLFYFVNFLSSVFSLKKDIYITWIDVSFQERYINL